MPNREVSTSHDWDDIAVWWRSEIADDPIYACDVHPLYASLVADLSGTIADLGCGDGQAMPMTGEGTIGIDLSHDLLRTATTHGPCVRADLPDLRSFRDGAFDHAVSVYLVDLIPDEAAFFRQVGRVVDVGGSLVVVMNHPVYTAPGSAPIADSDGEVMWRWGHYRSHGASAEPAGEHSVVFYHRPLDVLVNAAADAGWILDRMIEQPLSREAIDAVPGYEGQDSVPRLLGIRWRNGAANPAPDLS